MQLQSAPGPPLHRLQSVPPPPSPCRPPPPTLQLGRGSYSKLGQERLWTSHLSSYFYAAYLVSSITNGSPLNFITNWPAGERAARLAGGLNVRVLRHAAVA